LQDLYDGETGRLLCSFYCKEAEGNISAVAFTFGDRRALSGHNGGDVCVWDLEAGLLLRRLVGGQGATAVCGPVDGSLVMSADLDGCLRIWDAERGESIVTMWSDYQDQAQAVAVSGDGKWVVIGSRNGLVQVMAAEEHDEERLLGVHGGKVSAVCFLDEAGELVASTSADKELRVWDTKLGEA
jgi:WD40 repeat protein